MVPGEKLCLWNGRALFLGAVPDLDFHQQAAALVCIGIDGDFELARDGAEPVVCGSALIGPQIYHALRPRGTRCAFLFFDPDNPDYDFLTASNARGAATGMLVSLNEEEKLRSIFTTISACADDHMLREALAELELAPHEDKVAAVDDQRIQLVMRRLISEPGESIPIETLAAAVDISPSRLAHLFKEQVGVPIRMFRTWYRLKTAILCLKDGMTLTDAALRAGFYDSAHFTNTFRDTFGLSPSLIFSPQRRLHWYLGETAFAVPS